MELVDFSPGHKPLGYKWIFKRKLKADGSIDKYKARFVVKGYKQKEGVWIIFKIFSYYKNNIHLDVLLQRCITLRYIKLM